MPDKTIVCRNVFKSGTQPSSEVFETFWLKIMQQPGFMKQAQDESEAPAAIEKEWTE